MKRWLLRLGAFLSLVAGLYFLRDADGFLPFSFHSGWTLYPPGYFEAETRNVLIGGALLLASVALAVFSLRRYRSLAFAKSIIAAQLEQNGNIAPVP